MNLLLVKIHFFLLYVGICHSSLTEECRVERVKHTDLLQKHVFDIWHETFMRNNDSYIQKKNANNSQYSHYCVMVAAQNLHCIIWAISQEAGDKIILSLYWRGRNNVRDWVNIMLIWTKPCFISSSQHYRNIEDDGGWRYRRLGACYIMMCQNCWAEGSGWREERGR